MCDFLDQQKSDKPDLDNTELNDEFLDNVVKGDSDSGKLFQFKFSKQGEYVAVAYENDFFIGEVTDVQSTQLGTVQFLEKGYENVFKWPRVEEVCIIDSKFVFAASFDVISRNNGRTWLVPEYDELNDIYKEYHSMFF